MDVRRNYDEQWYLESNPLTSSLLKICSLYKFYYKLHVEPEICVVSKLKYKWNVAGDLLLFILLVSNVTSVTDSIGYHSLHGSIMDCSLRVTRAGVAGWECECWVNTLLGNSVETNSSENPWQKVRKQKNWVPLGGGGVPPGSATETAAAFNYSIIQFLLQMTLS